MRCTLRRHGAAAVVVSGRSRTMAATAGFEIVAGSLMKTEYKCAHTI